MDKKEIQRLETQYLKAKVAYYDGNPIMSDAAFDRLEETLKNFGSKVIEQVGAKRKDFNFPHPTPMLSLAKIQTERINDITNYREDAFKKWFDKINGVILKRSGKEITKILKMSPKFDGSAINIIYSNRNFQSVLTRGDGKFGKDISDRFKNYLPSYLKDIHIPEGATLEIRCECVMSLEIFEKKYKKDFANARNIVAGILGKDDFSVEKVKDLTLIPVAYLINGRQIDLSYIPDIKQLSEDFQEQIASWDYVDAIKKMEKIRNSFPFPLDGVVFSTLADYREILGENSHDPEWSIAIKFVPEEVVTPVTYPYIEWSLGKTGEFTPVVLLQPVQLAGTTVKRASGYNAGYIIKNKIGPGTYVSIAKAGDIIPEIQSVEVPASERIKLLEFCPHCNTKLTFDGIHLMCKNKDCSGIIAKKLAYAIGILNIKGIGGKTIEPFAKDFKNLWQILKWVLLMEKGHYLKDSNRNLISKWGIIPDSRSHEIFIKAFTNIKSLKYSQVILMMGYDGVGRKLSEQVARDYTGLTPDYGSLEKALVMFMQRSEIKDYVMKAVSDLELLGIKVDKPKDLIIDTNSIFICMTGSPKSFGFKSKAEFLAKFNNVIEVDLKHPNCNYLITDDYNSTSSKMKTANKKGIQIKTYGDFKG